MLSLSSLVCKMEFQLLLTNSMQFCRAVKSTGNHIYIKELVQCLGTRQALDKQPLSDKHLFMLSMNLPHAYLKLYNYYQPHFQTQSSSPLIQDHIQHSPYYPSCVLTSNGFPPFPPAFCYTCP